MHSQVVLFQLLLHVGGPFLFVGGIIPLAEAIRFITLNTLDIRTLGNEISSSFQFKTTKHGNYWVVVDSFYFPLKGDSNAAEDSPEDDTTIPTNLLCDRNCSTWGIYSIMLISVLLGVSIVVYNFTVRVSFPGTCNELSSELARLSVCFTLDTNTYINCSHNTSYLGSIGCYQLFTLLRSSSLEFEKFKTVIEAFLVLMITDRMIYILFRMTRQLLRIKWTKLWAAGISMIGAMFVLAVLVYYSFSEIGQYNLRFFSKSEIYNLFIFCSDIMIVGLLLLFGRMQKSVNEQTLELKDLNIITANDMNV